MQRGTHAPNSNRKLKRQVRFPGLMNAAAALGVHRNHLYQVLAGKRKSVSLTTRYQELVSRGGLK